MRKENNERGSNGMKKHIIRFLALTAGICGIGMFGKTDDVHAAVRLEFQNGQWRPYTEQGIPNMHYTGMAYNDFGWWYVVNGQIDFNYTGMASNEYGWWYFTNGVLDTSYTGMACNEYGWWYYVNGSLDFNYTGMALNDYGWWYYTNGSLDNDYTGMACNEYGWWYYINGHLVDWYTGVTENEFGKWYYENGTINFGFTGMFKDDNIDWVYVNAGQVIPDYTGLAYNDWGAWYFNHGVMEEHHTGMASDYTGAWYYMKNGEIDERYTGMAQNEYGWWYLKNGKVDLQYEGIARNREGTWYVKNGMIDTSYTGTYEDGDVTYSVINGAAKAVSAKQLLLGVFFNSREDTTDTLYVSFDGYDFKSIGAAFVNAFPEIEENNIATVSPSLIDPDNYSWEVNTLHDPSIFYRDGYFWMCGGFVSGEKYYPMMAYSTDLVNWSYPSTGKSNGTLNQGLIPTLTPLEEDGTRTQSSDYDAVAMDFLADDDGTVWLVVALGHYADSHDNKLSQYIIKATGLNAPVTSEQLTTMNQKMNYSDFDVQYGELKPINLPGDGVDRGWDYDYDGSLYKKDGVYYFVVQHSGEVVQIWSIDDLNNASDENAWTLVNINAIEGSEGPFVTEYNNKLLMYTDRYMNWEFFDCWTTDAAGNEFGIFASTLNSISEPSVESVRITTTDWNGNTIPARHGTVITLTDPNAINTALSLYNQLY